MVEGNCSVVQVTIHAAAGFSEIRLLKIDKTNCVTDKLVEWN